MGAVRRTHCRDHVGFEFQQSYDSPKRRIPPRRGDSQRTEWSRYSVLLLQFLQFPQCLARQSKMCRHSLCGIFCSFSHRLLEDVIHDELQRMCDTTHVKDPGVRLRQTHFCVFNPASPLSCKRLSASDMRVFLCRLTQSSCSLHCLLPPRRLVPPLPQRN